MSTRRFTKRCMVSPRLPTWMTVPFADCACSVRSRELRTIQCSPFPLILLVGRCSLFGLWGRCHSGQWDSLVTSIGLEYEGGLQDFPVVTVGRTSTCNWLHSPSWSGYIGTLTVCPRHGWASQKSVSISPMTPPVMKAWVVYRSASSNGTFCNSRKHSTIPFHSLPMSNEHVIWFWRWPMESSSVNFFDDQSLQPLADWHPRLSNTVYCDVDRICPRIDTNSINKACTNMDRPLRPRPFQRSPGWQRQVICMWICTTWPTIR